MVSNLLLKLIKLGIGFVLFIPLYVGGSFFFPFIFPKIWLFQLITEIILLFYIVLAVSDSRYRPKLNLATYALLSLTIILIITGFTGIDVFRSFWGNTERMSGTIAWLHFAAFAVMLSGVLKSEKDWRNFFAVAVLISVLEFFYVLAQYLGQYFIALQTRVWMPGSQMGTIGNTDLVGTYAIFSAFFALYLWQNSRNIKISKYQYFWAAAFFLNIGTLFLASSRGAIVGFGAGLIVYLAIQFRQNPQIRKIIALAVLIPVVLYGLLWLMRGKDFVKNNSQLTRIVNASLKDDTVQQRFTEWGIARSAFKARPIFGFGPNNYLHLHNTYLNPRVYELRETNFDRAHNAYLDYASMSGILGLAGYLFLIAALFWVFLKNKVWVFASLAIAYAVNSFFVFDSPASYISLFLTIGFAMFVKNTELGTRNLELGNKFQPSSKLQAPSSSPQTIAVISIFYLLFSIFLIWIVSIKPAVANYKFVSAFSGASAGIVTPENAFKLYKESLKYETLGTTEFRNQYITWLQANLGKFNPENRLEVLDFGIGELEKEVKDHPNVFSFLNLGQMQSYKARGIQGSDEVKREIFSKSADAYDEALKLAPNRLEVYYSYLQWAFDTKNPAKGVELMEKAAAAAPNFWQTHWYLGIAHIANSNNIEGVKSINRALAVFYSPKISIENYRLKFDVDEMIKSKSSFAPQQEILGVVNPYIEMKMWPELLVLYLSAGAKDQNNINLHQSLALVYQNLGLADKVEEELKIVESLQKK